MISSIPNHNEKRKDHNVSGPLQMTYVSGIPTLSTATMTTSFPHTNVVELNRQGYFSRVGRIGVNGAFDQAFERIANRSIWISISKLGRTHSMVVICRQIALFGRRLAGLDNRCMAKTRRCGLAFRQSQSQNHPPKRQRHQSHHHCHLCGPLPSAHWHRKK
jgi:hypothetical protein